MNTLFDARFRLLGMAIVLACCLAIPWTALAQNDDDDDDDPDIPSASLNIENMIPNGEALLPTNNWSPIAQLEMVWDSDDEPAPRHLASLRYTIAGDPDAGDRAYDVFGAPGPQHLYEFALIAEIGGPDDNDVYGELGEDDQIIIVWDGNAEQDFVELTGETGGLTYFLDFIGDGDGNAPDFPLPIFDPEGSSYILAVRTSALWHHGLSFTCSDIQAWMVHPDVLFFEAWDGNVEELPAGILVNEDGEWLDGYPWEQDDGPGEWFIDTEAVYTASFGVYDVTGHLYDTPGQQPVARETGSWQWPHKIHTPLPEFTRPRWDQAATAFDFVQGNFMELRRLFAIETWYSVVGINLRGTASSAKETFPRLDENGFPNPQVRGYLPQVMGFAVPVAGIDAPYPVELSVVMSDIGADPLGPPGNGGFDPREGLEFMSYNTLAIGGDIIVDAAYQSTGSKGESAFNGVWLYHDNTGNNIFDRPTPAATGVSLTDKPMLPWGYWVDEGGDPYIYTGPPPGYGQPNLDPASLQWQHVPNPPHEADPWWRITMLFGNGRDGSGNRMAATPTGTDEGFSNQLPNYFITVRADSGYADSSEAPGDGVGINFGAETQLMIEPRIPEAPFRGGMIVTSQFPLESMINYDFMWNEHPALMPENHLEPWWPQRTQNLNNTKPFRFGLEVHDYVQLNTSWSNWATVTPTIAWPRGMNAGFPDLDGFFGPTFFDEWLDPNELLIDQFLERYSVGVTRTTLSVPGIKSGRSVTQPYESTPFLSDYDSPIPRSNHYPNPDLQPERPMFDTWPGQADTPPYRVQNYPQESDWDNEQHVQARKLQQRIGIESLPTPMLGINLVGVNDPRTMQFLEEETGGSAPTLEEITVAFWGPDFSGDGQPDFNPDWLRPLTRDGLAASGVALYVDDGTGVFSGLPDSGDAPLELRNLAWSAMPKFVDLTGDGQPDDLNGDGIINDLDRAWIVRMRPQNPWFLPAEDFDIAPFARDAPMARAPQTMPMKGDTGTQSAAAILSAPEAERHIDVLGGNIIEGDTHWGGKAMTLDFGVDIYEDDPEPYVAGSASQTRIPGDPDRTGFGGDSLYVVVRTSGQVQRFGRFKAMIPAHVMDSPDGPVQQAGIQIAPGFATTPLAYSKTHPDENAGDTAFFEHELLETNVPVRIRNLTSTNQTLPTSGDPRAVLGIEASTNRGAKGRAASGTTGSPGNRTFTVSGANWIPGSMIGHFLIDRNFEAYEIVGNTSNQLSLLSGTPRSGPWYIAKDPTFLEQVVVEFYVEPGSANLNPLETLLPLSANPEQSGVALYRDNNNHPDNRVGVFDPGVDIPVQLDHPPFFVGTVGEPRYQVMMVFSSPGTSGLPVPGAPEGIENQPRRRQVIPDSFGPGFPNDAGPDFFVVLRAGPNAEEDVAFRTAIVGWGPATPTLPDPHIFPPPVSGQIYEHKIFDEFPFGSRGLGFISVFANIQDYDPLDSSGYNWVRSRTQQARRTNPIQISAPEPVPSDPTITSVDPTVLPDTVPSGGLVLEIRGANFGTSPRVELGGTTLQVESATSSAISARIPGGTSLSEPLTLRVTRTTTGRSATWSQFTVLPRDEWDDYIDDVVGNAPTISSISPNRGGPSTFPIEIIGTRYDEPEAFFGSTRMRVVEWEPTRILVAIPSGGLAQTGALDVLVRNTTTDLSVTREGGFTFSNPPADDPRGLLPGQPCFIATAAYGTSTEARLDVLRGFRDGVLLKSAVGAALVDGYYAASPPVADVIAESPVLALVVRLALEPIILALQWPILLGIPLALMAAAILVLVRRRRSVTRA